MPEPLLALAVLMAASGGVWAWLAWRRGRAMRRGAADLLPRFGAERAGALVLAFTTQDCASCKVVQQAALEALAARRPGRVVIHEIDALAAGDLVRRFGILTVPSTVVISPGGRVVAINHGAVTADRLAAQAALDPP